MAQGPEIEGVTRDKFGRDLTCGAAASRDTPKAFSYVELCETVLTEDDSVEVPYFHGSISTQEHPLGQKSKNTSVDITYSLFLGKKHIETKKRRGETVIFHLKISNANETGPYKCKTNVSNLQKYSQELNFTITRKAQRESKPEDSGDAPMQGELYVNVCEAQTEAGQPQELHYVIPVFKEVAPREQEGCVGNTADYTYSEVTY
ncbi:hypothetical protein STEG23_023514 [Scotinomys teguina]